MATANIRLNIVAMKISLSARVSPAALLEVIRSDLLRQLSTGGWEDHLNKLWLSAPQQLFFKSNELHRKKNLLL